MGQRFILNWLIALSDFKQTLINPDLGLGLNKDVKVMKFRP